jgi:hypothetical protein
MELESHDDNQKMDVGDLGALMSVAAWLTVLLRKQD